MSLKSIDPVAGPGLVKRTTSRSLGEAQGWQSLGTALMAPEPPTGQDRSLRAERVKAPVPKASRASSTLMAAEKPGIARLSRFHLVAKPRRRVPPSPPLLRINPSLPPRYNLPSSPPSVISTPGLPDVFSSFVSSRPPGSLSLSFSSCTLFPLPESFRSALGHSERTA